jgi:hypothetical protein
VTDQLPDDHLATAPNQVVVLHHVHDLGDGDEDVKLVGVYSDEVAADAAISRKLGFAGFAEHPDGFEKSVYTLDEDAWSEGFVTVWPDEG